MPEFPKKAPAKMIGGYHQDSKLKPKEFKDDVTFGTNGSYLEFKDSSALGDDTSGNGNDFSLTNLAAIDQTTDTCTNNFATLNSLVGDRSYAVTFEKGNLRVPADSSSGLFFATTNSSFSSG